MLKHTLSLLLLLLGFFRPLVYAQGNQTLLSPDKNLSVKFVFNQKGELTYSLSAFGKTVLNASPMGFADKQSMQIPSRGWKISSTTKRSNSSIWKPVWGKRSIVSDIFNEMKLSLKGPEASQISHLDLEARAYNDGIAFRYILPKEEQNSMQVMTEMTGYNCANDYTAWYYNGEYPNIGPEKISESDGKRFPVMTIKADNNLYLAVHEADLSSGEPLVLKFRKGETKFSVCSTPGKIEGGFHSAWRVLLCGRTPGALIDSHMLELLNPEPEGDFSWVKPGVAVWDWRIDGAFVEDFKYGMNYQSWIRMIDFAAENNLRHLVLDANWYGPEHEAASDPLKGGKVTDVQKIIAYGNKKNVGVWLYLNDVGGKKFPIEKTLEQYSQWGASGIKYGFMKGTAEEKNLWTRKITQLCAKYHLLCDFHDGPVHPYGQMRTFPNALAREYCHSQLDAHRVFVPKTFVTSVFVNMVAGPIDMNNGMFDLRQGKTTRVDENQPVPSTLVSEAARTLIVFSGATILPDIPEYYRRYPALLQFISSQKMPWKQSQTLAGEIGEFIVMAREASDGIWLVGAATNESPRELDIPLNFLKPGEYTITVTEDGEGAHYLTNRETLQTKTVVLSSQEKVHVRLAAGGGACLRIAPLGKISPAYEEFKKSPRSAKLADFSYAGYRYGDKKIPDLPIKVDVTRSGIVPNTGADLTDRIQNLIDSVGQSGGGVIYFPKGKYCINMDTSRVRFLTIDYSNIVLRGEGSGERGTILFCGSNTLQEKVNPWLSPAMIRTGYRLQPSEKFWGAEMKKRIKIFKKSASASDPGSDGSVLEAPILTSVVASAQRGDQIIKVEDSRKINSGDCILLVMYNTSDDSNLLKELTGYDNFTPDLTTAINAGEQRAPSFQWLVEVEQVIDQHTIRLAQPLRIRVDPRYEPAIAFAPMLQEIGIENIRFESGWDGIYLHHGGGKNTPRVSKLMDYGWNAINFCRVKNGWMNHVVIDGFTNPIYLQDSRNVTVQNVTLNGKTGHAGIKIYAHACDNLVHDVIYNANFTHMISGEGNAYGNVFKDIVYYKKGELNGDFDFHGFAETSYAPPAWNLYENIRGFNQINGGGAPYNMPHTAKGNVWWNVDTYPSSQSNELFVHWCWTNKQGTPPHYMGYPGSIVVGYGSKMSNIVVNNSATDRNEKMIYTESINQTPVYPVSLYEAQRELRLKGKR